MAPKQKNSWLRVIHFSLPLIIIFGLYHALQTGTWSGQEMLIKGVTHAGLVLIGMSLWLGTLAKFWNRFDRFLFYRKFLGITGFLYLLFHGFIALWLYLLPNQEFFLEYILSFTTAYIALLIFAFAAKISEIWAIRTLGSKRWRRVLRYSTYTAFILSLYHVYALRVDQWTIYLLGEEGIFPSLSLVTFSFGIILLIYRFGVFCYDTYRNLMIPSQE